jgi:radical SAM superfamily enzyme YgiQ (UPF0313 family)
MGYGISPASLRLDDLTEPIIGLLKRSGERSITIAPETGSDRLRRVINKTVTNEQILDKADLIFRMGIENLKLYYMVGLPSETDEDLVAIRDATLAIRDRMQAHARQRGTIGRLVASVNPLVPKPGTTYQWLPMTRADVIERAQANGGNWRAAVADAGLDAEAYLYRDRTADAFLPWQIIDGGLKTEFFRTELDKSTRAEWTLPRKQVVAPVAG